MGWLAYERCRRKAGGYRRHQGAHAICLDNFNKAPDAQAKLIALKAIGSSWQRETFVKEGKWATVGNNQNSRVADACAEALFNLKQ